MDPEAIEVQERKGFKRGFVAQQFRQTFGHWPKWKDGELNGMSASAKPFVKPRVGNQSAHPWLEKLEAWTDGKEGFTARDALVEGVGISKRRTGDTMEAEEIIESLGFYPRRRKDSNLARWYLASRRDDMHRRIIECLMSWDSFTPREFAMAALGKADPSRAEVQSVCHGARDIIMEHGFSIKHRGVGRLSCRVWSKSPRRVAA
jgi:hypothetical protein